MRSSTTLLLACSPTESVGGSQNAVMTTRDVVGSDNVSYPALMSSSEISLLCRRARTGLENVIDIERGLNGQRDGLLSSRAPSLIGCSGGSLWVGTAHTPAYAQLIS